MTAKKPYIFIADDIMKNLQVLGSALMEEGYEVGIAGNGSEALNAIIQEPPDLILLDVMMPVMDGFETCRKLKANEKIKDIPVIFLTAKTEMEDIVNGFRAGGADYISKPFSREELLARVRFHTELKLSREKLIFLKEELENKLKIISKDLDKASRYIWSLLPEYYKSQELTIDWKFVPSNKLGGDTFGYHFVSDDCIAVYLIDVCGHGIGSALHSVAILNTLKFNILRGIDYKKPSEVLGKLNDMFNMFEYDEMFFTIWYGVYNTATREFRYSAGGHHPAILLDNAGSERYVSFLECNNLVVGAMKGYKFAESSITVNTGTCIYVFSDAAFEMKMPDGSIWNIGRLAEFLSANYSQNTGDINMLYDFLVESNNNENIDDDFSIIKLSFH